MSPEQLFNTLKLLFPALKSISKSEWITFSESTEFPFEYSRSNRLVDVDWGDTDEYPVQNNWRNATIDDIQDPPLKARFRDYSGENWREGYLTGITKTINSTNWLDEDEDSWTFCQVEDINKDLVGAKDISTYPSDNLTRWLYMGGKWLRGYRSHTAFWSWDMGNQPTHWK